MIIFKKMENYLFMIDLAKCIKIYNPFNYIISIIFYKSSFKCSLEIVLNLFRKITFVEVANVALQWNISSH